MNRLWLALRAFWRVLTDPAYAASVLELDRPAPAAGPDLRILALLQRDGRLLDFLQEDIEPYADAQIGAAVRDIHRGCRKAIRDYITLQPVIDQPEDSAVTVPAGFDPAAIQLSGQVAGSPPFKGVLRHQGWRVASAQIPSLPAVRDQAPVLAPAEVEIA